MPELPAAARPNIAPRPPVARTHASRDADPLTSHGSSLAAGTAYRNRLRALGRAVTDDYKVVGAATVNVTYD